MNFFEDFTKFLESRLDEFLQSNPQLNLTIIAQELKQEKLDNQKLILKNESDLKNIENKIFTIGKDIQVWHNRIEKAQQAGRLDLAQEAENREKSLLAEGALLWRKMEEIKEEITIKKELLASIHIKEKEINQKIEDLKKSEYNQNNYSPNEQVRSSNNTNYYDDLEDKFKQWEIELELEKMKNNL